MELNERVITMLCSHAAANTRGKSPRTANAESEEQVTVMVLTSPRARRRSIAFTASVVRPEREIKTATWFRLVTISGKRRTSEAGKARVGRPQIAEKLAAAASAR